MINIASNPEHSLEIFPPKQCGVCLWLLSYMWCLMYIIESDWQYVAMVLDRLFLWIFTIACVVGTGWIILCAPSLYDDKQPIDIVFSKVGPRIRRLLRT
ncbi:acetylcholine receptor subunit alpha-like 1 [Caerostris darwini]|uniref:Acetylcholine receptor subunit alpha-like 1 n=1 Tax=Caerostris darwini TaxID=1538125 RepID=A0AAV4VR37_9ARAC|nr:acetylcholine receptor subunit alpha-like 1 [Caerostris darwini]